MSLARVESVAHHRVPPPLGPDQAHDAYSGEPLAAEPMTQHPPTEICLWVARHRVADCGYPTAPGVMLALHPRFQRARPVTAVDLSAVPAALAAPEPPPPWETQP